MEVQINKLRFDCRDLAQNIDPQYQILRIDRSEEDVLNNDTLGNTFQLD